VTDETASDETEIAMDIGSTIKVQRGVVRAISQGWVYPSLALAPKVAEADSGKSTPNCDSLPMSNDEKHTITDWLTK
jgi:hypothetical protein